MSIMNDRELFEAIKSNAISISPLDLNDVQPASIDLRLHGIVEIFEADGILDIADLPKDKLRSFLRKADISPGFALEPGGFVTGYSEQIIKLPGWAAGRIYNRNSLASIGLDAAISAFINPGFCGRKVIVIRNFGPAAMILRPGMRICQLEISRLSGQAMRSFADRHDPAKLDMPLAPRKPPLDNSLSQFLDERIKAAARGMRP